MADDYIITARKVRKGAFIAEPGPVLFLKVPKRIGVYGPEHAMSSRKSWVAEVQGLADGDENPNSISPRGDVLIFVHGYNNDIPVVLQRTRQLQADLRAEGWRGKVISFDWPSNNQTLNYLEDRHDAAQVASKLVSDCMKLLMVTQKAGCQTNVHVLGHSTGAYVIMEAFAQAEKQGDLFKSDWRIGQAAFISGDVSSDSLSFGSDWSNPMFRRVMRFTNYVNPFDGVLGVSNAKRLGTAPRAGRVGLPALVDAKAVNIDCGEYFQTLNPKSEVYFGAWTHSWQIGNRVFARDLAMTMEGAIDRHAIPTRREANGKLLLQDKARPEYQRDWNVKSEIRK